VAKWYRPATLDEALEIRARETVIPIAGATDLYVRHRRRSGLAPAFNAPLLAVGHLAELRGCSDEDGALRIGAGEPYADILADGRTPALLAAAVRELAAPALRNVATLGGNICNASPAADAVCPLYALDARCELRSSSRVRSLPIAHLITGPGRTLIEPDELLTAIVIPPGPGRVTAAATTATDDDATARIFYRKVGTRRANALSKLAIAAWASLSGGAVESVGVALGAVAPTVVRSREAEAGFAGSLESLREKVDAILAAYGKVVAPIDDQRSTAEYRREVALNLVKQFIEQTLLGDHRP
jgi:CO/xanthine dehydrogenase FAD-binding subunit